MVKHFSGAKINEMQSYIISTLEQNSNPIIIHPESNDLKSDRSSEEIAWDIINLTKAQTNKVILSSLVPRYGNLNYKTTRANKYFKKEYEARNIFY